ncbi:ComEC/Rec2 family competence protein [Halovulum sp. GXIMD14793]
MRLTSFMADQIEAQRGTAMLWAPVMLAIGIGWYFARLQEPSTALIWTSTVSALMLFAGAAFLRRPAVLLPGLIAAGLVLAWWQTQRVAAPVLGFTYFGTVEGRIVDRDRSASNYIRLTLDQVYLRGVEPDATPARIRISLTGPATEGALRPGARVMVRGRLGPPGAPVEPGGFDFRRHAWFERVGAVGYARDPLVVADLTPPASWEVQVFAFRMWLADAIRARMQPDTGAFAAAILTGDRSEIAPDQLEALRASNLAHLLAISGLHMGLVTGLVFAALRYGLALLPAVSLWLPVKKMAAASALLAGVFYLVMSGASVATQRAFIMAAVALGAVMLDRPVLTLRAVAIAACLVLILRPDSLTGPGFQMSFAATTALVVGFNALRQWHFWKAMSAGRWRYLRPVLAVAFTSFIAGAATMPFSAFHFNGISQYGFVANLAAVPVMGLVVMPAAAAALVLAPLGLSELALAVMGYGIAHILGVANYVAGMDGALLRVPSGPSVSLGLMTFGLILMVLLHGRLRTIGAIPVVVALVLWAGHPRPLLLVASNGRTIGILTPEGRAISSGRGNSFAVSVWLENDGDAADMEAAFARPLPRRDRQIVQGELMTGAPVTWTNAKLPDQASCHSEGWLIAPKWNDKVVGDCHYIGAQALARNGAHGIYPSHSTGVVLRTARDYAGDRPWTGGG